MHRRAGWLMLATLVLAAGAWTVRCSWRVAGGELCRRRPAELLAFAKDPGFNLVQSVGEVLLQQVPPYLCICLKLDAFVQGGGKLLGGGTCPKPSGFAQVLRRSAGGKLCRCSWAPRPATC